MPETTRETTVMEAEEKPPQPPRLRVKVGLMSSFFVHQSIYCVGTALAALLEKNVGVSHVFQNSPSSFAWLAAWTGGAALFWRYKRPRLLEWATPLPLFSFYWILAMGWAEFAVGWHSEIPDHQIYADFALTMSGVCGSLWMLTILLSRSGFVLGNSHVQKVQIKRWLSGIVPAFRRYHDVPEDILIRISSPTEAPLPPAPPSISLAMEPVLPHVLHVGQTDDLS